MSGPSKNMAETKTANSITSTKDQEKKRKREDGDRTSQNGKKQKGWNKDKKFNKNNNKDKKGGSKPANKIAQQPDREEAVDESISKMNEQILADHFLQKAKAHNKDLTAVELSDMSVPVQAFQDTTSFEEVRKLAQLPEFLKAYSPEKGVRLGSASEEKGSPHTLVIASAGLRAADLVRLVSNF